ncbi:ethylmalonyl-CoA decarboxylase-like [Glandiceps talaboti]
MLLRRVVSCGKFHHIRCMSNGNGNGSGKYYYESMQFPRIHLNEPRASQRIDHSKEHAPISFAKQITFNENEHRLNLKTMNGGSIDLMKEDDTGIAMVTISNPNKSNAMSGSMMVDLRDIVTELEDWKHGKAVILHGCPESGVFCGGADLNVVGSLKTPGEAIQMCLYMQNTLNRLLRLPLISVAAIHGKAIGGGAELITACDFRLMTPDAGIQYVQINNGITPGWGGGSRLTRLLGPNKALKLLVSGKKVSTHEALQLGLADGILDSNDVINSARDWLKPYTRGEGEVIQAMKCVVVAGCEHPLDNAMRKEKDLFAHVWGGKANKIIN